MTTEQAADGDATAEFDIVVVGSGAGGMTAALAAAHLGASAVVLEKAGAFGGTTARSGGGIWAPGNAVLRRAGVADTPSTGMVVGSASRRKRRQAMRMSRNSLTQGLGARKWDSNSRLVSSGTQ